MKPSTRTQVQPFFMLLAGILAVSTGSIFVRFAQTEAPSLVIAAYRLSLATLILCPFALNTRKTDLFTLGRKQILLAFLSGIFLAIHFATWITSLEYTDVASSVVLVTTTPLWVAILSPVLIKERPTKTAWIGLALAMIGGIIIGLSGSCSLDEGHLVCPQAVELVQGKTFLGNILALTGGWMAAAYVIIGRSLRKRMSLVSYIFTVYGMAAVVLVILMFTSGNSPLGYLPATYLWFLLLALVPQLLGHTSFNYALGHLSAAFVSIALLGEPIGATILAYLLLGEIPTSFKIFGAILILTGILVASFNEQKSAE
jgi:drug/metabolite transporter (DMT)-like permease